MKSVLRNIVLKILVFLARIKLRRMGAKVIGVTGSVGKTTCKDVIYDVLSRKYKVLKNKKSFNSEFGLPLTILHQESGFSSPLEWLKIIIQSIGRVLLYDKYDYLVLEMGVDKPGDMDFLTRLAPPDIALITAIKPVHLDTAQFQSIDDIFTEKKKIFSRMTESGKALISLDDRHIAIIKDLETPYKKITYGFDMRSDIRADNFTQTERGIEFNVHYKDFSYSFLTPLFGEYHVSILLPAIATGLITDVPIQDIEQAISKFSLPPGRMSLIEGIQDTLILDSSYNASPEAVKEALKVLSFFGERRGSRRVFIFGNMNELGEFSKDLHHEVGEKIPAYADILITVGSDVRYAASAANKNGMPSDKIWSFDSAKEAADHYKKIMQGRDVILAKGSQNRVRLEIFVKELMAHPEKAKELLVRQEKEWENIAP